MPAVQAAELLGCTPGHVSWLARHGHLPGEFVQRRWMLDAGAVRRMTEDRSIWISFDTAAEIADCARETLRHAVAAGRIEQRTVSGRIRSLRREDVERFAKDLSAERQRVAQARAQRLADRAQKTQPPDDGHVWVDAVTAAAITGFTARWINQLAARERLPAVRRGRAFWFRRDHVEQWAAARAFHRATESPREARV